MRSIRPPFAQMVATGAIECVTQTGQHLALYAGTPQHPLHSFLPPRPPHRTSPSALGAAGEFHRYDASNECGVFGATSTMIGGHNCYVVVQVTNVTSSPVNFVPADIRMVDQNGVGYTIEPVYPACYDSVDVNAPVGLRPHASTTVQLCYPVQTGALPQKLLGTASLTGLSFVVPPNAIVGTWGGS